MGCSKVYALLTIRESNGRCGYGSGAQRDFSGCAVHAPCAGCRHGFVPCTSPRLYRYAGLHTAYASVVSEAQYPPWPIFARSTLPRSVSARPKLTFWYGDGSLAAVMVPLLEIAARLKSIPPQGWPQDAPIMGCCWNGGVSTSMWAKPKSSRQN